MKMEWANFEGKKVRATPNGEGYCPGCGNRLIPHCGEIYSRHWAHPPGACDPWYEPETRWHINWKNLFPVEQQEIRIGCHRADIKGCNYIVELQHSSISADEIHEREEFYKNMIWVFDLRDAFKKGNFRFRDQENVKNIKINSGEWRICEFSWSWMRKSIASCRAPILIHLDKGIVLNIYNFRLGRGYAHQISQGDFLEEVNGHPVGLVKPPSYSPVYYTKKELYEMRVRREYRW